MFRKCIESDTNLLALNISCLNINNFYSLLNITSTFIQDTHNKPGLHTNTKLKQLSVQIWTPPKACQSWQDLAAWQKHLPLAGHSCCLSTKYHLRLPSYIFALDHHNHRLQQILKTKQKQINKLVLDYSASFTGALKSWYQINPFTLMSYQDRISPYNIYTMSSRLLMRMKKVIN